MQRVYDLTGQRFGRLTAKYFCSGTQGIWECICDCGNTSYSRSVSLRAGKSKSCGCTRHILPSENLRSKIFGRLTVKELDADRTAKNGRNTWSCSCVCWNNVSVIGGHLKSGVTQSCGCLRNERKVNAVRKAPGYACFNSLFHVYRSNAKRKGRQWNLTKEQAMELFKGNCIFCLRPPSNCYREKRSYGDFLYNGIDRIDNSSGYEIWNCISCCGDCNRSKSNKHVNDFLDRSLSIAANYVHITARIQQTQARR